LFSFTLEVKHPRRIVEFIFKIKNKILFGSMKEKASLNIDLPVWMINLPLELYPGAALN